MMKRLVSAAAVMLVAGVVAVPALAQDAKVPAVSHDIEGRDQCLMCHTAGAMEAVPDAPAATHADRMNDTCMLCHAADSPMLTAVAPAVSHSIEGRDQCMMCHKAGAMEAIPDAPAGHEEMDLKYCTLCHEVAG